MAGTIPKQTVKTEDEKAFEGFILQSWQRTRRNPEAVLGAVIMCIFVIVAILAPKLSPYNPFVSDFTRAFEPPGRKHWLGGEPCSAKDAITWSDPPG